MFEKKKKEKKKKLAITKHKRATQQKSHNAVYVIGTSKTLALKHLNKPTNYFLLSGVITGIWQQTTNNIDSR